MIVFLKPIGDLRDYFGHGQLSIELPDGGHASDVLEAIHKHWGHSLPTYMWDAETHRFRGPFFMILNGKILDDTNTRLQDGQQITLMKALAGG